MKIKIERIFGKNNVEFDLLKKTTIYLGENGCGKSTALKILKCVLRGDYCELIKYNFERIIFDEDLIVNRTDLLIQPDYLIKYTNDKELISFLSNNFLYEKWIIKYLSSNKVDYYGYNLKEMNIDCLNDIYSKNIKNNYGIKYYDHSKISFVISQLLKYLNKNTILINMAKEVNFICGSNYKENDDYLFYDKKNNDYINSFRIFDLFENNLNKVHQSNLDINSMLLNKINLEPDEIIEGVDVDVCEEFFGYYFELSKMIRKGEYDKNLFIDNYDIKSEKTYNLIIDLAECKTINMSKLYFSLSEKEYLFDLFINDYIDFISNYCRSSYEIKDLEITENIYKNNFMEIKYFLHPNHLFYFSSNRGKVIALSLFYDFYNEYKDRKYFEKSFFNNDIFIKKINYYFSNKRFYINNYALKIETSRGELIDFEDLSEGEQKYLIILFLIYKVPQMKDNLFLLLDEPDTSLSIAWQKDLVDMLNDSSFTTIITTQSPFIANSENPYNGVIFMPQEEGFNE